MTLKTHKIRNMSIILVTLTCIVLLLTCLPLNAAKNDDKMLFMKLIDQLDYYEYGWSPELDDIVAEDLISEEDEEPYTEKENNERIENVIKWENKIKSTLGASDAEWKAIRPLLLNIMKTRLKHFAGRSKGLKGGPPTPYIKAGHKLYVLMTQKKEVPTDIIKKAIKDYYAASKEEVKESEEAAKQLRALVTSRQEALLVIMNFL